VQRPGNTAQVADAVRRAAADGLTVRVAGAGHSFSDAVLTDGLLLDLGAMGRVIDVDRGSGLVRVQAGITLRALSATLWAHGLAMENLGDVDVQSLAGATATGTHGTGARLRNLSAGLEALQLVTADGDVVEVSCADSDPDPWRAARVSIGALGVVTEVTLRAVPRFGLEGVDVGRPIDEVLERLDDLVAAHDHFEFFVFPHATTALTRTNNRAELPARIRGTRRAAVEASLLSNGAFGLACRAGRARPALIPAINRLITRGAATRSRRVDRSYRIFASPRKVRFTEMEYAIPREHAVGAVQTVRAIAQDARFDVPFPIEVRFVAGDDALLSPACGRDTCYIAVHMYRGMPWQAYFAAVEEALTAVGGRPHWGKRHTQTEATLAPRYPGWERFQAVRRTLDPEGRFANAYVRRTLGPPAAGGAPARAR
jgi:FAD-linked oxidoreductase